MSLLEELGGIVPDSLAGDGLGSLVGAAMGGAADAIDPAAQFAATVLPIATSVAELDRQHVTTAAQLVDFTVTQALGSLHRHCHPSANDCSAPAPPRSSKVVEVLPPGTAAPSSPPVSDAAAVPEAVETVVRHLARLARRPASLDVAGFVCHDLLTAAATNTRGGIHSLFRTDDPRDEKDDVKRSLPRVDTSLFRRAFAAEAERALSGHDRVHALGIALLIRAVCVVVGSGPRAYSESSILGKRQEVEDASGPHGGRLDRAADVALRPVDGDDEVMIREVKPNEPTASDEKKCEPKSDNKKEERSPFTPDVLRAAAQGNMELVPILVRLATSASHAAEVFDRDRAVVQPGSKPSDNAGLGRTSRVVLECNKAALEAYGAAAACIVQEASSAAAAVGSAPALPLDFGAHRTFWEGKGVVGRCLQRFLSWVQPTEAFAEEVLLRQGALSLGDRLKRMRKELDRMESNNTAPDTQKNTAHVDPLLLTSGDVSEVPEEVHLRQTAGQPWSLLNEAVRQALLCCEEWSRDRESADYAEVSQTRTRNTGAVSYSVTIEWAHAASRWCSAAAVGQDPTALATAPGQPPFSPLEIIRRSASSWLEALVAPDAALPTDGGSRSSNAASSSSLKNAVVAEFDNGEVSEKIRREKAKAAQKAMAEDRQDRSMARHHVHRARVVLIADALLFGSWGDAGATAAWRPDIGGGAGTTAASTAAIASSAHGVLLQRAMRYKDAPVVAAAAALSKVLLGLGSSSFALKAVQQQGVTGSALPATDGGGSIASGESIVSMLDQSDTAARCVVHLVADAARQRPHVVIPELFRLLRRCDADSGTSAASTQNAQENALDVLALLPSFRTGSGDGSDVQGSSMEAPATELEHRLAAEILQRLEDDRLLLRTKAAALFAKLPFSVALVPLRRMALERDSKGNRRAAATKALQATITACADGAIVKALMKVIEGDDGEGAAKASAVESQLRASDTSSSEPLPVLTPAAIAAPAMTTPGDIATLVANQSPAAPVDEKAVTALAQSLFKAWAQRGDSTVSVGPPPVPDPSSVASTFTAIADRRARAAAVQPGDEAAGNPKAVSNLRRWDLVLPALVAHVMTPPGSAGLVAILAAAAPYLSHCAETAAAVGRAVLDRLREIGRGEELGGEAQVLRDIGPLLCLRVATADFFVRLMTVSASTPQPSESTDVCEERTCALSESLLIALMAELSRVVLSFGAGSGAVAPEVKKLAAEALGKCPVPVLCHLVDTLFKRSSPAAAITSPILFFDKLVAASIPAPLTADHLRRFLFVLCMALNAGAHDADAAAIATAAHRETVASLNVADFLPSPGHSVDGLCALLEAEVAARTDTNGDIVVSARPGGSAEPVEEKARHIRACTDTKAAVLMWQLRLSEWAVASSTPAPVTAVSLSSGNGEERDGVPLPSVADLQVLLAAVSMARGGGCGPAGSIAHATTLRGFTRRYVEPLVVAANRLVAGSGQKEHMPSADRCALLATQCIAVLFNFILLSPPLDVGTAETAAAPAAAGCDAASTIEQRHCGALFQFAVGCVRFRATAGAGHAEAGVSAATLEGLRSNGLRLLAALLTHFPESTLAAAGDAGVTTAASAVGGLAHIGVDGPTRQLAEQLLTMLAPSSPSDLPTDAPAVTLQR